MELYTKGRVVVLRDEAFDWPYETRSITINYDTKSVELNNIDRKEAYKIIQDKFSEIGVNGLMDFEVPVTSKVLDWTMVPLEGWTRTDE